MARTDGPQLRECRIILPTLTQKGELFDVRKVRKWVEASLAAHFGGWTITPGAGECTMEDGSKKPETVFVYDVAIPGTEAAYRNLVRIALGIKEMADQETVYVKDPWGRVFIGATAAELTGEGVG